MAKCQNPECRNGLTPGVIIRGKGTAKMPVLGSTSTWGWVSCLACSPSDAQIKAGAVFKLVKRSAEEISQRAALATAKAPYKQSSSVGAALQGVRQGASEPIATPVTADPRFDKLLEQVTKLTEQVTELLAENRELRKQLNGKAEPPHEQA